MTPFTIYDTVTGEVLSSGTADDPAALAQPGTTVVAEMAPRGSYRDGNGWKAKPQRPSANHTWNWSAKQWEDQRTADQKWAQVRQQRDRIFATTVDRINALRWEEMSARERIAWKEYRRALQDITTQPDPDNVVWPEPPAS